jgi:CubicO group peptidase (beta-lactamase class C family)
VAAGAFESACEEVLARAGVPGAAVGVLSGGESRLVAHGVLEAGGAAPVTPENTFRIASVTKPFTATLALYLSLSGVIALDEEVPGPVPELTVHHLLSHTGGFEGEHGDLARYGEGDDALPRLAADLLGQRQLTAPDELWSYCNAGYWLLGQFMADRLGATFEELMHDWVLRPLGLASTGFGAPAATGHAAGRPLPDDYPRARRASGGLVSNVGDLLAFARFHAETPETSYLRAPVVDTPDGDYGFGFTLERVGELELWGHHGSLDGWTSLLALDPESGFAYAALANAGGAGRALDELLGVAVEQELGVRREPPETVEAGEDELAALAGGYRRPELELDVRAEGDALVLEGVEIHRVTGARARFGPLRARPIGPRRFAVDGGELDGDRFDFHPREGEPAFVRFGSVLAERVS